MSRLKFLLFFYCIMQRLSNVQDIDKNTTTQTKSDQVRSSQIKSDQVRSSQILSDIIAGYDLLEKRTPEEVNKTSNLMEDATSSITTSVYHDTILHPPKTISEGQVAAAKVAAVKLAKTGFVPRAFTRAALAFTCIEGHSFTPIKDPETPTRGDAPWPH